MAVVSDLETALEAIIKYFGQDVIEVKRIDKSALIEMKTGHHYYFKFDRQHWHSAGRETGKFGGSGFAINADVFKTIDERYNADILYCNSPNIVYEFNLQNFKKNSHKHTQRFNGEEVYVISLYDANQVFYI
jgi:hypothetical protein